MLKIFGIKFDENNYDLNANLKLLNLYIKKQIEINNMFLQLHQTNQKTFEDIYEQLKALNDQLLNLKLQITKLQADVQKQKKRIML